jgi:iron(II)-dependent oxidoreductase
VRKKLESVIPKHANRTAATSTPSAPGPDLSNADAGRDVSVPGATNLSGTKYVISMRAALVAASESKIGRELRAERLTERFRHKHRIACAVRVRAADDASRLAAAPVQNLIVGRLKIASLRSLDLVPYDALTESTGWKRILVDVGISQPSDAAAKLELVLHEFELTNENDDAGEPLPDLSDAGNRKSSDVARGIAIGDTLVRTGPLAEIGDAMALEVVRRLDGLADVHFDNAERLLNEGDHGGAVEEFVRFLHATSQFDSPQAERANQYVIGAHRFSLLDWLWGESEVAVVEDSNWRRRLPLGFRAASSESWSAELPNTIFSLRDGSEMVLVTGGTELMGNDSGQPEERPAHSVTLRRFYIDRFETSVAQYGRFLAATDHRIPEPEDANTSSQWTNREAKQQAAVMPVVGVSWHDARAFAQWMSKSLPSEAQWERAARGGFGADYPRSFDSAFARHVNAGKGLKEGSGFRVQGSGQSPIMSVYSFSAALNPYGCQNMLGNVAEWCRDWYDPAYYGSSPAEDPIGPATGELRAVRGGSWQTALDQIGSTARTGLAPTTRSSALGFRCVLNLSESH